MSICEGGSQQQPSTRVRQIIVIGILALIALLILIEAKNYEYPFVSNKPEPVHTTQFKHDGQIYIWDCYVLPEGGFDWYLRGVDMMPEEGG